jgi:hypothetical protein
VFTDVAARAEEGRARGDGATETQEVVFGAARAVEQDERGSGRIGAGFEEVVVGEGHGREETARFRF